MLRHKVLWIRGMLSIPVMAGAMVTANVAIQCYRAAYVLSGQRRLRDWYDITPPLVQG